MTELIRGRLLQALQSAVNVGEASPPDGDLSDADISGCAELATLLRVLPRGVVLVPMTRAEARALLKPLDNSLCDVDFRKDHMDARQRKLADGLAAKISAVAWRKG